MASSISSGSGQASPARRARCRQSMTVVAPIDRLAAILRLDMPAAVSRSTSRTLRMGNLAPGIGPFPPVEKAPTSLGFADHPTAPFTLLPRNSQPLLGIARNGCSGSVGTTARDQSVWVLGINWNSCSGSALGRPVAQRSRGLSVTDIIYTATVYDKRLRGNKTRFRCSEECNRMGNIVGLADASHHGALAELLLYFGPLFLAAPGLRHIRAHEPRCHRIHSYSMRTKLQCETTRQDDDLSLCRGIKRRAWQRCAKCSDRSDVDDATISELAHAAHHRTRRVNYANDVN